jgi:uncharacterized phiE125 gp8 family phage protein
VADYAYNFDRRGCEGSNINYNLVHSIEDISSGSGEIVEPVTLEEMKAYLRLEGWDSSGEFDFDDALILSMITDARIFCEKKTGCSLIPKTIAAYITNGLGMLSLPAGPVTGTVSIVNEADITIDPATIKLFGTKFPQLKLPIGKLMVATYEAGYSGIDESGGANPIPEGLRNAIKAHVAENYEHRGDEQDTIPAFKMAATLCKPYIKYATWG